VRYADEIAHRSEGRWNRGSVIGFSLKTMSLYQRGAKARSPPNRLRKNGLRDLDSLQSQ